MSGFVAQGTSPAFTLSNDGFWPNIDAEHLRAAQRLDGSVTPPRLETAAVAAIISVNRELLRLKLRYQAAGHASLEDVPADEINGKSTLVSLYLRAVYSATSAEVAERYRTYSATDAGKAKADAEEPSADAYRRDQRFAIRDLLGISRTTVELL